MATAYISTFHRKPRHDGAAGTHMSFDVCVKGAMSTFVERTSLSSFGVRKPLDLPYDGTNETEKT